MRHSRLTQWLVLAIMMIAGQSQLSAQIVSSGTCLCSDDGPRVRDTVVIMAPSQVEITSYTGFTLPDSVLYHEADPSMSDEFYLSTDDPAKDQLVNLGGNLWGFISYRNGNVPFTVTFMDSESTPNTYSWTLPACSATVDDAIMSSLGDTICINAGVANVFALPGIAGSIDPSNITWVLTDPDGGMAMTGSNTTISNSPTATYAFTEAGAFQVSVTGRTLSNCPIDATYDVLVRDTAVIEGFASVCTGATAPFNLSSTFDGALYDTITWTVTGPSASFDGDSTDVSTVDIVFAAAGTYTVTVEAMMTGDAMCSFSDSFTITVEDEVDGGVMGDTVLCLNETRTYTSNVLNLASISWSVANGSVVGSSAGTTVDVQFTTAGLDTIYLAGMTSDNCPVRDTFSVDVKNSTIGLTGSTTVCVGDVEGYRAMYSDMSVAAFTTLQWEVIPMSSGVMPVVDTAALPMDSLTVTWGDVGTYMISVTGITDLGCDLTDQFTVTVQDTAQTILGPTLVCAGDVLTYNVVQSADSTDAYGPGDITWKVFRHIPGFMDVAEVVTDTDGNDTLAHVFTTGTIDDDIMYILVAEGMTSNGCPFSDTLRVETIGISDLDIAGDESGCAGGIYDFQLLLDDSLRTSALTWSAYQKSNNAPVLPSLITSDSSGATIDFPNVADTFVVQVTGMAGTACTYNVMHEIVLTDDYEIIDADILDTLCLTPDSTWYAINVDTADIDITTVTWSITSAATSAAVFPVLTGSGMPSYLSAYYTYPAPGVYTHRVRGMLDVAPFCEFDEIFTVTVKDTFYQILGDFQICLGDTTQYVLTDGAGAAITDFPSGDSLAWFINGAQMVESGPVATGSLTAYGYSFAEFSGPINDTLNIVWFNGGTQTLSVSDSTLCCPIEAQADILVRDMDFMLVGDNPVCNGDTKGYKITNFDGSDVNDLVVDSSVWTSPAYGRVVNIQPDSITILWNHTDQFITTTDTITFSGLTDDGCLVSDTLVVTIQSTDVEIIASDVVCQGDPVSLDLVYSLDSSIVGNIDSILWVFTDANDTLVRDTNYLRTFVDASGVNQNTWTEPGTYTVRALAYTDGTCNLEAEWVTVVSPSLADIEILGDLNTCINSNDIFFLNIDFSMIASLNWTVTAFSGTPQSGATIVSGQSTDEIEVRWSATGNYRIEVSGITTGGCAFSAMLETVVIDASTAEQLACNNDINVTLPDNCELMLTPDQILQDRDTLIPDDQYEIVVEDAESGIMLSNGLVDASLLGTQLKVRITHECSGQSCWGYITLEDKNIPQLLCGSDTLACTQSVDPAAVGYPVPSDASVSVTSVNPPIYSVTNFEKCGAATLTYQDRIATEVCTGDFGTLIYRDWTMTNQAGLTSQCTDTILVTRLNIDSLDLSNLRDFIGDDGFACHEVTLEDLAPGPLTGQLNINTTDQCFNLQMTSQDVVSEFCGTTYRITRTWTILDWCTGKVRTHTQTIDVLDREGPIISLASSTLNIEATDHACSGVYDMTPDINISDRCSEPVTATVRIFENDETGRLLYTITDGIYSGLAFDPDVTQIFIDVQATDACTRTNQRSITRAVNVVDNVAPIPTCDETTTISIGDAGWAIANWQAFDDGATDNCGIESIQVRRMENSCDDAPDNLIFGDYVKFCCADAMSGEPVMVQVRVTDVNGNTNDCMVSVDVQDNSAISKVVSGDDMTISCSADITPYLEDDGSTVTFLTATCGLPMAPDNFTVSVDTSDCGTGTITRTWSITDRLGNSLTHIQTITRGLPSETFDPATLSSIWPTDYDGEGCAGPNTTPESLPAAYRPNIDPDAYPCSSLYLDYEDLIFRDVEGYCAKVLRTWTLYDWCVYDANRPSDGGKWEYVQVLKINDTVEPVISSGCQEETFTAGHANSCSATVTAAAIADDCHDTNDLAWTYEIKDDAGTTVRTGNRSSISTTLEVGTYTVTWTATDPCGNAGTCDKTIIITDGAAPVASFNDITRVMSASGITINASDALAQVTDNCSPASAITYRFNAMDGPEFLTFDCQSLQGQTTRSVHPDIFAIDAAGNVYKSHINITILDTNDACGNAGSGSTGEAMVAGVIYTSEDFTIDEVAVQLKEMSSGGVSTSMTTLQGTYAFDHMPMDKDYEVSATREDDYLNGVSVLDMLLIQRHILAIQRLDDAYKAIAADVDGSGHISAIDLVHLKRLLLGITDDLPVGMSWTFVDAQQTFADVNSPFPYENKISISDMSDDMMDVNFVGVKMGDVSGDVQLESSLLGITRSVSKINVAEVSREDDELKMAISLPSKTDLSGIQLQLNIADAKIQSVRSGAIDVEAESYHIDGQTINVAWASTVTIDQDVPLFYITVEGATSAAIEEIITLHESTRENEIYTGRTEIEISKVYLDYQHATGDVLAVEQNVPNPFVGEATIEFYQPAAGEVTFRVMDLSGKQLILKTNNYSKGWHKMNVNSADLSGAGIYIYEVSNGTDVIRKKMITIQ